MILTLEDRTILAGRPFGANRTAAGEVVFNTGLVGYPEALTDPSYRGQILVLTYPLIGNYGVDSANSKLKTKNFLTSSFESEKIQIAGLIVSEYCKQHSHPKAVQSLADWLKSEGVPAMEEVDTRALTQKLREKGTMLGVMSNYQLPITNKSQSPYVQSQIFDDPNKRNLAAEVSCQEPIIYEPEIQDTKYEIQNTILLYDCGVKFNIIRSLLKRGCRVIRVPWDFTFSTEIQVSNFNLQTSGIVISNGPGDPTKCDKTIEQISKLLITNYQLPILGICLGNQILALAAGAKTYKLKYGHRGQNQPVIENLESGIWNLEKKPKSKIPNSKFQIPNSARMAFITSQNHGFAVDKKTLPGDWEVWFTNLNDGTVEGIRHKEKPWLAVQFHPEASPGPTDTEWIFDKWLGLCVSSRIPRTL